MSSCYLVPDNSRILLDAIRFMLRTSANQGGKRLQKKRTAYVSLQAMRFFIHFYSFIITVKQWIVNYYITYITDITSSLKKKCLWSFLLFAPGVVLLLLKYLLCLNYRAHLCTLNRVLIVLCCLVLP